ncbi:N-acetyltransferase [Fusibacter ferrireducens]|uniref:GNAT family N-acetyltransferase n=1 Tax=Fusibacter ferrireducens TaxID=2785058 RepID=A0ABR9ZPT7_9FIRM|nr:N-acetyltransferase [Fusibacter ferrireducens]MBF4692470.1 GNAT family N-acetyltransferase [Fusibacter ferrireducens]
MNTALVTVDLNNIDTEHICCAISEKKGENCVGSKKAWLKERFEDGMVFTKLNERGKVFIEYMPAESCFAPITAPNYMYISCLWVSGKFKGQGYSNQLLDACIEDAKAKGKKGLVALGSKKKMHFLTDPNFLKYKGFKICDMAEPSFELLYYPFDAIDEKKDVVPQFKPCVKTGQIEDQGVVIYYSNGCPHTDKYVPLAEQVLKDRGVPYRIIKLETVEEAQNAPTPCTIYTLFIHGKFVTNEVLTEKKLVMHLEKYDL